ncbi:hypothetical protein [Lyngbya confervoides]|uniref:Uncharacterized protein n=1 Tax=Lyngbya confervoides BDU141951 TaxID=1574623 RepID=A0ABD4T6W5_9CYAN|nr:hypothetical protein [Lyngbya confervoides]MCM1984184.1 hypothetical protein [Lyngbya confervoides BDU141951]
MLKSILSFSLAGFCILSGSLVRAESWQDWVQQHPTYDSPAAPPSTSPQIPGAPAEVRPVDPSAPDPVSGNRGAAPPVLSTHNPLFEQQFLAGCETSNLPSSYCQCALREVQNTFTFQELLVMSQGMKNRRGEIPPELMTVALRCFQGQ